MIRIAVLSLMLAFSLSVFAPMFAGAGIKMIRSLSGPSGKVVGSKFVLDEIRNRFVYPQDNSLTVYFECVAPKADYILTAYWKDPQGKTVAISPDLKMQTVNEDLNSYWIFMIDPNRASGIWSVEIRINGEPVGTHSFELVIPESPKPAPAAPAEPTMDELYSSVGKSLVWVHKLNDAGIRIDTTSGFVVAADTIMTAFQSIDMAAGIEIEFANGTKSSTNEIVSCNRLMDLALIKVKTGSVPPLEFGRPDSIVVGADAIVFSVGTGASRIIGTVDIAGRGKVPGFGERIHINPQLPPLAVGGPLLDLFGKVIGVIGGNLVPGIRPFSLNSAFDSVVTFRGNYQVAATPVNENTLKESSASLTLRNLLDSGILTPPLSATPVLKSATITSKVTDDFSYVSQTRFSRKDPEIIVCSFWESKENISEGILSENIFDAANQPYFKAQPHKLRLSPKEMLRNQYRFIPRNLEPGPYRIDLFWNGIPVWRSFIFITD
jgi:hypothetical protein